MFDQEALAIGFLDEIDLEHQQSRLARLPLQRDSLSDFKTIRMLHTAFHVVEADWFAQPRATGPVFWVEPKVEDQFHHLSDALDDASAGFPHDDLASLSVLYF